MSKQVNSFADASWVRSREKIGRMADRIGDHFPHCSEQGVYQLAEPSWWTAGFWPGLLWLIDRDQPDEQLRGIAQQCEESLDGPLQAFERLDHDLGFMWSLTSVAQYKLLGTPASKRRALTAASHLAGRFNIQGRYIRAWNPWWEGNDNSGYAIIDCLMNMPLLYWASEVTGDPRFRHVAMAHTDTTLKHFIRTDGSVHHIIRFDPDTGEAVEAIGGQGYAAESAWSRGTAWALYGLTLGYKYTKNEDYLSAAKKVAHFFIANLPADGVPEWDFRLPTSFERKGLKDSSAGACAASALLELSRLVTPEEADVYYRHGAQLLRSLDERCGTWDVPEEEGLLRHGTGNYPEGRYIDVSLIYGDYFFVEGLAKLRGQTELFW